MRCGSASSALATGSARRPLWRCLAFAAAGREVRQSPLFRVAGASGSFALSRLTGFFDLAGHLGCEFEDSVFGVVRVTVQSRGETSS